MSKRETTSLLSVGVLTVGELAARLEVSTDRVRSLEQEGALFSYVRSTHAQERLYPLYQLAAELDAELLRRAHQLLGSEGALLHQFFSESDPDLADLCVREVLAGCAFEGHALDEEAALLLDQPVERRMEAVQGALERLHAATLGQP